MQINNNVAAFNAYRNLSVSQGQLGKSLEKLSSGFRINRASDDASGLVISENLRSQIGGLRQATRNAQDGVSVVQTAEGALTEVHSMLQRMRDLAVQSASTGTYDQTARDAAQAEIDQLAAEIDRVAAATKFGNTGLLDGTYESTGSKSVNTITNDGTAGQFDISALTVGFGTDTVTTTAIADATDADDVAAALQAELDAASSPVKGKITVSAEVNGAGSLEVTFQAKDVADGQVTSGGTATAGVDNRAVFHVGAGATAADQIKVGIGSMSASSLQVDALDMDDATAAIESIDAAIGSVSTTRGDLGAIQNRLEHTVANLQVAVENVTASESRIRDTDMAAEMTTFTRNQIMQQAGTAMLAQANQLPQSVLSLLR